MFRGKVAQAVVTAKLSLILSRFRKIPPTLQILEYLSQILEKTIFNNAIENHLHFDIQCVLIK